MNLNEMWRNLVERPRLVNLLVIFYGSHAFLFVLIFIVLGVLTQVGSGQPPYRPGGADIAILLIYIVSLVGALLYLSIAWGILVAKGWARILGISVSILVLPYLILGTISGVMTFLHMYPYIDLVSWLMFLVGYGILTTLNIASIYFLTRAEVKAYFKKKPISEREEELSKKEYEKLMKEEYEQLMKED